MNCLFENYENQPENLSKITSKYITFYVNGTATYKTTEKFLKEVEKIGYTFDYGLDNEPFNLRIDDGISILASDFDISEIKKPF